MSNEVEEARIKKSGKEPNWTALAKKWRSKDEKAYGKHMKFGSSEKKVMASKRKNFKRLANEETELDEGMWSVTVKKPFNDHKKGKGVRVPAKSASHAIKLAGKTIKGLHTAPSDHFHVQKEETLPEEQINELKKSTLASYIKKAHSQSNKISNQMGNDSKTQDVVRGDKERTQFKKRSKGKNDSTPAHDEYLKSNSKNLNKLSKVLKKRKIGINRAVNKLTKEEIELDEIAIGKAYHLPHPLVQGQKKKVVVTDFKKAHGQKNMVHYKDHGTTKIKKMSSDKFARKIIKEDDNIIEMNDAYAGDSSMVNNPSDDIKPDLKYTVSDNEYTTVEKRKTNYGTYVNIRHNYNCNISLNDRQIKELLSIKDGESKTYVKKVNIEGKKAKTEDIKTTYKRDGKYFIVSVSDNTYTTKFSVNDIKESLEREGNEINELKKSTLASYINKASDDAQNRAYKIGKLGFRQGQKDLKKTNDRSKGIKRATNKLAKEETELDPVNKKRALKKFKVRKDKDIDNDGDTDSSDKYLHKKRNAITKSVEKES